ncbi:MAG: hypothetical protein JW963_07455 [Anaerolineales bacterium]|nr:hypothetical protein [Anaerolineales bacterium]
MKRHPSLLISITWLTLFLLLSFPFVVRAQNADPVVRAILFYSPSCPHCAMVIQEDLPPLFDKYGTRLEILGIDVSQPEGTVLYQNAITRFQIPQERLGVPTLIIADTVLVGSLEIPEQFPGLVEYHMSQGGVDWPDIPGLAETITVPEAEQPADPTANPSAPQPVPEEPGSSPQGTSSMETPVSNPGNPAPTDSPGLVLADDHNASWQEKFSRDLAGNTLSVIVLLGMVAALVWVVLFFTRADTIPPIMNASWFIPPLCLLGLVVAGYLAYVETAQISAVCGPVGDCNTVQQSEYARLFGILPIGIMGLVGYIMIVAVWLVIRFGRNGIENLGALALLGMTLAGTLFSVYLTFLEPFVIGATCAWCLTSAVLMTVLMLLSLGPGKSAYLMYVKNQKNGS